jgi:hypothetical protein
MKKITRSFVSAFLLALGAAALGATALSGCTETKEPEPDTTTITIVQPAADVKVNYSILLRSAAAGISGVSPARITINGPTGTSQFKTAQVGTQVTFTDLAPGTYNVTVRFTEDPEQYADMSFIANLSYTDVPSNNGTVTRNVGSVIKVYPFTTSGKVAGRVWSQSVNSLSPNPAAVPGSALASFKAKVFLTYTLQATYERGTGPGSISNIVLDAPVLFTECDPVNGQFNFNKVYINDPDLQCRVSMAPFRVTYTGNPRVYSLNFTNATNINTSILGGASNNPELYIGDIQATPS